MAAAPGTPLASVVMGHHDDFGEYDVRRHGTPPRPVPADADEDIGLMAAHAGATGQATVGGVVSMNHSNQVAGVLRTEMLEMRATLEAKINSLKIEFEVKMSGRKGTGHWESGAIETLIEKNNIVEQMMEDVQTNMDTIKDIKELIENDEKITDMIKKYKELSLGDHVINVTKKLKNELDKGLMEMNEIIETVKKNTEENMSARFNDLTNAIAEVKKHVNGRSGMPSLTPLSNEVDQKIKNHQVHLQSLIKLHEDKIEDKFKDKFEELFDKKLKGQFNDILQDVNRMNTNFQDAIMMHIKNFAKEASGKEDNGETREYE